MLGGSDASPRKSGSARGDCGDCARSSRGSVKGRVKNNRSSKPERKKARSYAFVRSRIVLRFFFFFSPLLFFFSFFFSTSRRPIPPVMARLNLARERFCRNFNYFLLTPCRGYLCNTPGPPAWFRSSDRRVNSTRDLLRPFYTGSLNM